MGEPGVAHWLSLAAAPTFATLALLNGALAGGASPICAAAPNGWPVGDMALMYLLMSVFHTAPWLKLIAARRLGRDSLDAEAAGPIVAIPHDVNLVERASGSSGS